MNRQNKKLLIVRSDYNSWGTYINKQMLSTGLVNVVDDFFTGHHFIQNVSIFIKDILKIKHRKYDTIIVFNQYKLAKLIKRFVKSNICVFFWNSLSDDEKQIIPNISKEIPTYTFDSNDANRYNLHLTQQFYFPYKISDEKIENDVFFVGIDKDRLSNILKLKEYFDLNGISYDIHLMKDKDKSYDSLSQITKEILKNSFLSYDEVLNKIIKCKAILDITKEDQVGLTIRSLEALFLKKKLITNNINILNERLYSKDNVFILGKDDIDTLKSFIISDYLDVDKSILDYYSFESWLKNFYE